MRNAKPFLMLKKVKDVLLGQILLLLLTIKFWVSQKMKIMQKKCLKC